MSEGKWQKVLYKDQNVPDNYVDESFLMEMRKNVYVRSYRYWDVVHQTTVLTQEICTVCCLVLCWWLMDEGSLTPQMLLKFLLPLFLLGFVGYSLLEIDVKDKWSDIYGFIKTSVVVLCATDFLSPILKTLTDTISTDTIYAMTTFMILGHLLFHDYGADAALVSRAVSLNMGLFFSICLASRLDTSEHVFAIVILALMMFGLWPTLRRNLWQAAPTYRTPFTFLLTVVTFCLLLLIHVSVSFVFLAVILFITFVCPFLLLSLQPHKNNIYGPWDEAVISVMKDTKSKED